MIDPRIVGVIQARMNSRRLPGKVLMEMNDKPLLLSLVNRVRTSKKLKNIIVATTEQVIDDKIVDVCEAEGVDVFRGSENDVLDRMICAGRKVDAEAIVRLTADNPFVGGDLIDLVIEKFVHHYPMVDYVSNTENSGYPMGLYVEVVNMSSLEELRRRALSSAQIEHVTLTFRSNNEGHRTYQVRSNYDFGRLALSVDTIDDYVRLAPLFRSLCLRNRNFSLADIAKLAKEISTY